LSDTCRRRIFVSISCFPLFEDESLCAQQHFGKVFFFFADEKMIFYSLFCTAHRISLNGNGYPRRIADLKRIPKLMYSLVLTITIAFIFLSCVLILWTVAHLLAGKRFGFRKQGCKGPVTSADGTLMCCKGDGSTCDREGLE